MKDHTQREARWQRKTVVYEASSKQNEYKRTRQHIYNPKRDSENPKSNKVFRQKNNK